MHVKHPFHKSDLYVACQKLLENVIGVRENRLLDSGCIIEKLSSTH